MKNYIAKIELPQNIDAEEFEGVFYTLDCEGFEAKEQEVDVYFNESQQAEMESFLKDIAETYSVKYTIELLENKNWNEQWEAGFQPVVINDFVAVRATFHPAIQDVEHEIIIDPKMSFGTGHHATTMQMMQNMRLIDFKEKTVLDLGSGTGILAILAEKLGACSVVAVDNDEWCFTNAEENCKLNHTQKTKNILGGIEKVDEQKFDIILANIHRNYLVENMQNSAELLKSGGYLFCSGFYDTDAKFVLDAALECNLYTHYLTTLNQWDCIIFGKQ
ncbi:MAG TPA: 50S ribosomal protein L11 methyltransferase [Chitinophagales bacterium]|nr:50S ribosomal protein L11 methyltransferase [Chitinophagales bacterium]